jgi:hypothetical protein
MILNAHCVYYQNILYNFTLKNRSYVFMLPQLPLMTAIFLLVLEFLKCIASTTSYKFISYTKML